MKICPFCAEQIQDQAIICRHCGNNLAASTEVATPAMAARPVDWKRIGIIALVALVALIIAAVLNNGNNQTQTTTSPDNQTAYKVAQSFVQKYLQGMKDNMGHPIEAVGTAQFSNSPLITAGSDANIYNIVSYATTENFVNAEVKHGWRIQLKYTGSDAQNINNWVVISLTIDAKAMDTNPPPSAPIVSVHSTSTIIGFGATLAGWNNNHTADPRFNANAVYDPDPNVDTSINGGSDDKYSGVSFQVGRALNYTMNLPKRMSIAEAKTEAMKEFPSDAKILWYDVQNKCSVMEVQSKSLGAALSDPKIGDPQGMVNLMFVTVDSSGYTAYNPNNINQIQIGLGSYAAPSDENTGCQ